MKKLSKQIKESFFNPIFHFFPLLIFLVLEEFFGMSTAWNFALPAALILLTYVYFAHKRIFIWHFIFTLLFIGISIVATLHFLLPIPVFFQPIVYKFIVFCFVLFLILFRKHIETKVFGMMSRLIPMSNNFNELYRVVWTIFIILLFYIFTFLFLKYNCVTSGSGYYKLLRNIFVAIAMFFIFFELLRVQIIRTKLVHEEWWPIVTKKGKIIGSIEHSTSLMDKKKYIHPVVRVLLIDKSMVFLQKNCHNDLLASNLWDTPISNHVRMGESIDQCVERTAVEKYALTNFKYVYLSTYLHENRQEQHYAFLFVSCQSYDICITSTSNLQTKWWTQQQIEENLEAGIFSENFKIEYDLLQRSGLLETDKCECSCRLKDVIYKQTDCTKNKL